MGNIVIGLTGPTGAGKSTAAAALRKLGCGLVDCDKISGGVLEMPECIGELVKTFGKEILDEAGQVNRAALARRAFSCAASAQALNDITHPLVLKEMARRIAALQTEGARAVVVDAALLFESGADACCTTTIAVTAPVSLRLERIMSRDGLTKKQANRRISAQQEMEYYVNRAHYNVNGGANEDLMLAAVEKIFAEIMGQ